MLQLLRRAGPLLVLAISTPAAGQRSARRVLHAAEIAAAGWHRLGDVAAALPPGTTASFDGFNVEMGGPRLGFAETTGSQVTWRVRLDGQDVPVRLGGLWILDAIPVAMTQVDSIAITEGPLLSDGRAAFAGTIDLYTRRPRPGPSLLADYQHGDESGDPGPYRYTGRSTPNVEKVGPFVNGAAAYATDRAALEVAARYSSTNITDSRIVAAVGAPFSAFQSDVNASGGSGVASLDALGGRHYLIAGRGRFTGMMNLPQAPGIEQGRVISTHAGASGSFAMARREWRYGISATQLDLKSLGGQPTPLDTQRRIMRDAFVETAVSPAARVGAGLHFGSWMNATDTIHRVSPRAWLAYRASLAAIDLAVEHARGGLRESAVIRHARALADSSSFAVTLSALHAWRGTDDAWMDADPDDTRGMRAADLRIELTSRPMLAIEPTWYARVFNYSGIGTAGDVTAAAAGISAETSTDRRFTARLRGEVSQMLGDAEPGENSTPSGFVEAMASGQMAGGFALATSVRYAPSTAWPPGTTTLDPSGEVPSTQRVDFSLNKTMWRERIRAQLLVRNLLNADDRTHPDGAQWNLRAHLGVTIRLPSEGFSR